MSISEYGVHLSTDNPQAEILLIDSRFRILARGPSPLEHKVPVGLYSMKVKIGDEEREELFAVRPDSVPPVAMNVTAPAFSSPIPLANTATTHEYHQAAAQKYLGPQAPRIQLGEGSSLMVCVRDPSQIDIGNQREVYAGNFRGFRLLDAQGAVLVDFDTQGEHNINDRFMAARVDLSAGSYALAYDRDDQRVCIPLPVAAAPPPPAPPWVLQAYLQVLPVAPGSVEMRADFRDISLMFDKVDAGFYAHRLDLQAMETVRNGLIEGRNYVNTWTMHEMLSGKFENPMLGLYGAHLLLLEKQPNLALIETVIRNTAHMLGESYPDVIALAWAYGRLTGQPLPAPFSDFKILLDRLAGPPLLARSWDPLVDAARATDPGLFRASPAFAVAPDLMASGVYLTWKTRTPVKAAQPAPGAGGEVPPTVAKKDLDGGGKIIGGIIGGLSALAAQFLKGARGKIRNTMAGPMPVESIEAIKDTAEAAAVLKWIARSYDWNRILPEMKRDSEWTNKLNGLQRDLFLTMRNVARDKEAVEAITPTFVEKLLETYRVPLSTLVQSLSGLELGGYWSTALRTLLDTSKPAK